jgi:hypothetical protein
VQKLVEEKERVIQVACGMRHTTFVTGTKRVHLFTFCSFFCLYLIIYLIIHQAYSAGYGLTGCLGVGYKCESAASPLLMDTDLEIERAACGVDLTVLITSGGIAG